MMYSQERSLTNHIDHVIGRLLASGGIVGRSDLIIMLGWHGIWEKETHLNIA